MQGLASEALKDEAFRLCQGITAGGLSSPSGPGCDATVIPATEAEERT